MRFGDSALYKKDGVWSVWLHPEPVQELLVNGVVPSFGYRLGDGWGSLIFPRIWGGWEFGDSLGSPLIPVFLGSCFVCTSDFPSSRLGLYLSLRCLGHDMIR